MEWVIYIIEFIILFAVSFLYYYFFGIKINNTKNEKGKEKKQLAEVRLFVKLYHMDLKKITYKKLAITIFIMVSFNLALTVFLAVNVFDELYLKILTGLFVIVVSMYLGYNLLGLYYTKKGMITNVQSQKNRK